MWTIGEQSIRSEARRKGALIVVKERAERDIVHTLAIV